MAIDLMSEEMTKELGSETEVRPILGSELRAVDGHRAIALILLIRGPSVWITKEKRLPHPLFLFRNSLIMAMLIVAGVWPFSDCKIVRWYGD